MLGEQVKRARRMERALDQLDIPKLVYAFDKEGSTHVCVGIQSTSHPIKGMPDYMAMMLVGSNVPLDVLVENRASCVSFDDGKTYEHLCSITGKRWANLIGKHILVEEMCAYKSRANYYQLKVLNKQLSN